MFDFNENNQQLLPAYPSSIKGELRIILQVKDQFLLCFKHLEKLSFLWDQQNRIITKEFILEQIKSGDSEIEQLKVELKFEKTITKEKERQNDGLIYELQNRGEHAVADTSKRRVKSCKTALFRACHKDIKDFLNTDNSSFVVILEGIGEKIDLAQEELKKKLRPILEFYKDLFYLQLHFTLALTQISCFCMPLMTDSISLMDRLFFWTERPEFELIKRSGQICDRLRDIYTRLQRILSRLFDSVIFLQEQIDLQRLLEIKFYEKIRQIGYAKDNILESIHSLRMHSDLLEEENDRLVGTLVKIDPFFTKSDAFKFYIERKNQTEAFPINTAQDSRVSLQKSKKVELKELKVGKRKNKNDSDNTENGFTITSQNSNNFNMANATKIIPENLQQKENKSNEIKEWKNQILDLLSLMKKGHSKSDLCLNKSSKKNSKEGKGYIFSFPMTRNSEKYKVDFSEEIVPSSDFNQTDAFVMTSEILPKDD